MRVGPRASQVGAALIEGLLAMAICAFALLGLAAFQLRMSAEGDASRLRTQATLAVEQLVAAAQADASNAGCYAGRAVRGQASTDAGACNAPAAADWFVAWARATTALLPQGEATARFDPNTARYAVQVTWARPGSDVQNVSVLTEVRP